MKNYNLTKMSYYDMLTSSKGAQEKYYENGYFYKVDSLAREGLVERLSSIILSESNIPRFADYEECLINNKKGCRSKNFLKEGERFVSLQRLYDFHIGGELGDRIFTMRKPEDRIEFVLDFIGETTGLDGREYLGKMLSFDALILNTDRHFHNIGFVMDSEGYSLSPVFDNGKALLADFSLFPPHLSLEENINNVVGKPFLANLEMQAHLFEFPLRLNYDNIEKKLENEPVVRETEVIRHQMEKYKTLFRSGPASLDELLANVQGDQASSKSHTRSVNNHEDR